VFKDYAYTDDFIDRVVYALATLDGS